jgi:hypothetical protein
MRNPRCKGCNHSSRAALDADLLAGRSLREVARRYSISKDAAHRHLDHVEPEQRAEIAEQAGLSVTSVASRIQAIADDARSTRIALQGQGQARASLRAAEVELRTLDALASRLGITDLAMVEQVKVMEAVRAALAHSLRRRPEIAEDIAARLRLDGFREVAETVEQYAANQTTARAITDSNEEAHRG